MNDVNKLAKALVESAEVRDKKKTSAYDTTARVVKVEGSTAWVAIPGGVDKTPARMAVNAKAGDDVRVRVAGGKAYVMGNTTAPPTDDSLAKAAQDNAIRAAAAAEKASVSAETAHTAANNALRDAATAQESADIAQTAANNAVEDAARAHAAADAAQEDATIAKDAADTAKESADQALWGLSTVEDVVGTLNWITAHGTMTLTSDTAINPAHVYFVVDADGDYEVGGTHYSIVTEPKVEELSTYYELTVDESLQNYVGSHLALTSEGLWVLPAASGYKVLIATGQGTTYTEAGTYIIDGNGDTVAKFGATGTQVGKSGAAHFTTTPSNIECRDNNDNRRLYIGRPASGGLTPVRQISAAEPASLRYAMSHTIDIDSGVTVTTRDGTPVDVDEIIGNAVYISPTTSSDAYVFDYYTPDDIYTYWLGLNNLSFYGAESVSESNGMAYGDYSHAEGNSTAAGDYSHASGRGNIALGGSQFVVGSYNDTAYCSRVEGELLQNLPYLFIAGNGSSDSSRSNALAIEWNGNIQMAIKTTAASGTMDGDLYAAINALGWTSEVIE